MHGLDSAILWVVQASRGTANPPSTPNDPTHHGGERLASKCTTSEAQCMQRGSKNDLWNMRGRTGAPQRLLLRVTIISAKEQANDFTPANRASELCAASCATLVCQDPDNLRPGAWTPFVCDLCFQCCLLRCRIYCVCSVTRVVYVVCASSRVLCVANALARMSCVCAASALEWYGSGLYSVLCGTGLVR